MATTTRNTSKTTCVKDDMLVASCVAADMKTSPKMVTNSATKPVKIGVSCGCSLRTADATAVTTSRKTRAVMMSRTISIMTAILILSRMQTQVPV